MQAGCDVTPHTLRGRRSEYGSANRGKHAPMLAPSISPRRRPLRANELLLCPAEPSADEREMRTWRATVRECPPQPFHRPESIAFQPITVRRHSTAKIESVIASIPVYPTRPYQRSPKL